MNAQPRDKHHGESGWWAVREIDHLFSRFARYTRFVVYSKWSLLVIAGLLVLSLIAWPLLTKDKSGLRVSFVDSKTVAAQPESPVMENPEYRGSGDDGRQYTITGARATQANANLVVIDMPKAHMVKADGSSYWLNATRADYFQDKKIIELTDNVDVIDGRENHFTTSRATINTQTSDIYGNEQIHGSGPLGKLVASGFEIKDNGNHIIFVGGAEQLRVTVDRKQKNAR